MLQEFCSKTIKNILYIFGENGFQITYYYYYLYEHFSVGRYAFLTF